MATLAPAGVHAVVYDGLAVLPAFNPDDDHAPLPAAVLALRAAIDTADGLVFCTPEYAGALPGSFKNLLDWTVGGTEIAGKPVAWLNVAAEGRGLRAHESLAVVLSYLGATIVDSACGHLFIGREAVGQDGTIADWSLQTRLLGVLSALGAAIDSA